MTGRVQPRQLAFALPHAESLTRDNFLEGPANAAGIALVDAWPEWPNRIMLLVGPEGSGKSHLAAIWAEQAGARSTAAHALTPASVPGALATGALVVEDLRSADFDERALFHLMNLAREDEAYVLITARVPPAALEIEHIGNDPLRIIFGGCLPHFRVDRSVHGAVIGTMSGLSLYSCFLSE